MEAKSVVVYGIIVTGRDHHTDYVLVGEWEFILVERVGAPVVPREKRYRMQWVDLKGRFASGPTHLTGGVWRTTSGRFASGPTRVIRVPIPEREESTGRYARPVEPTFRFGPLPDDNTIVAESMHVIEEETGGRMYRTEGQRESGRDRVSIGIQHLTTEQYLGASTYTFGEYLAELRKRVQNEVRYA